MSEYLKAPIFANIKISFKRDDNLIYQTIRIEPNKSNYLKYFTLEKYSIGRKVQDLLQRLYIGDGYNIMFENKKEFKNTTVIRYRVDEEVPIEFEYQEYRVDGQRPKFDNCNSCAHLVVSKNNSADRCRFYKKFLVRHKNSCQDFLEKGDDLGEI